MKGIYGFKNRITGKWYIGQSVDMEARLAQHLNDAVEESIKFHKALAKYPFEKNNWEYHWFIIDEDATGEQLDLWEAQYIALYNSKDDGYNSTKGNHAERLNNVIKSSMPKVPFDMSKNIYVKFHLKNLEGKNVLVIGHFDLTNNLVMNGNDVTVISDSIAYIENGATVKRLNDVKEIIKEIETMPKKSFDLIIANPPYGSGLAASITKAVVDNLNFDLYINLMPMSKYKDSKKELYKNVDSISYIEDTFEGATVGESLTVSIIKKENTHRYKDYTELENSARDPKLANFYVLNNACARKYSNQMRMPVSRGIELHNDTVFVTGKRVCQDGVHKTQDTYDYKFNILKTITYQDLPIDGEYFDIWSIDLVTPAAKNNFNDYWYKNPLCNRLIKGLKKSGGSPDLAIPRIDWSKDRDYEHLTLEDIMNILIEENPNVSI